MFTPKRFDCATARPVSDCLFMQTSSIGGSSDNDVTALAVVPYGRASCSAVITVTPLAKWLITSRNSSDVRLRASIYRSKLGGEPLSRPAVAIAAEADAVVQAARPSLPELDHVRLQRVTAPVRRPRHFLSFEPLLVLRDGGVERLAARDHGALPRRPSADLAAARAAREVGVRERRRQFL